MLKRYSTFLIATSHLLYSPATFGMTQVFNVKYVVINNTEHLMKFCVTEGAHCENVNPGDSLQGAGNSSGQAEEMLDEWAMSWRAEACGKMIALKKMGTFSVADSARGLVIYTMEISEKNYRQACHE